MLPARKRKRQCGLQYQKTDLAAGQHFETVFNPGLSKGVYCYC